MSTTMTDAASSAPIRRCRASVDGIGYLDDTVARARQRAGVSEARVIRYRRPDSSATASTRTPPRRRR
jgi:hypothetical protein